MINAKEEKLKTLVDNLPSNKLGVTFNNPDQTNALIVQLNIEKELRREKELGRTMSQLHGLRKFWVHRYRNIARRKIQAYEGIALRLYKKVNVQVPNPRHLIECSACGRRYIIIQLMKEEWWQSLGYFTVSNLQLRNDSPEFDPQDDIATQLTKLYFNLGWFEFRLLVSLDWCRICQR